MRAPARSVPFLLAALLGVACTRTPPPEPTGPLAFTPERIRTLLAMADSADSGDGAYVTGKWLFLDRNNEVYSPMNHQFPKEKVAQRPSEVGTLFVESRRYVELTKYSDGSKGMGVTLTLTAFDLNGKKQTATRDFEARTLPKSLSRSIQDKTDIIATGDNREVDTWLAGLEVR